MAHVADHLSVVALEQQYRSCTDVTAARHLQTIWLLAKGHEIAEVAATVSYAQRWVERLLSSNSVVGQRMAVSFGVELSNRFVDGAVEVIRTVERLMSEVMPLQVAPETLDVVQLRSIFRQPLDGEPVGALGERGAACLAGVDRAVVEDQNDGLDRNSELGPIAPVDLLQESDEVRASFGPAGVNNEVATRPVEHAEHRHFGALARRRNAQVGPFLGPDVRQVGMGEGF